MKIIVTGGAGFLGSRVISALLAARADTTDGGDYVDIFPRAGQLVLFRSAKFWHEVLPARRERFSLTGWLRTRGDGI